jgi:hypothetical protein
MFFLCWKIIFLFFLARCVRNLRDGAASGLNIIFTLIISREMFLRAFYGKLLYGGILLPTLLVSLHKIKIQGSLSE